MTDPVVVIGLDVGSKRIGVARGSTLARLAEPLTTIQVDGSELNRLRQLIEQEQAQRLVVGLPRGLSSQDTQQTQAVRTFGERLRELELPIYWQDEALTTVEAARRHQAPAESIDAYAAAIILQDYLDRLPGLGE